MIPTRIKLPLCLVTLLERTFNQWTESMFSADTTFSSTLKTKQATAPYKVTSEKFFARARNFNLYITFYAEFDGKC